MKIEQLKYEDNAVAISGMDRKDWENFRDTVMDEGNADSGILFRFIAGAPGEFMADCVGSTEQDNQTTAMMAYIEDEFMGEVHNSALVVINAKFWEYFVYPMITLTGDWSDQTRERISENPDFWLVVDKIIEAYKEVRT